MSFLAPFFLLGALAVGLPIFLHLIRRSARDQVPFSSLLFLQPTPPRVTKRSRLEHLLLLLLRCLIICLLALGFARPFVQRATLADPAAARGAKVILLLDRSASMRRAGVWPAALARARAALAETGPGDQVAVYTFDDEVRAFLSFDEWAALPADQRGPVLSKRLDSLQPGWGATHLGHALTRAAEAFSDADRRQPNAGQHRLVLVSDLQEGARLDGLQGYDWPKGVTVRVEAVRANKPTNAGLQWLPETADAPAAGADPGLRVRVSNSANSARESFQIHWDGVAAALPQDVYVPPGQSRVVPAPKLPPNVTAERLVLTGDDDDFDNTVYVLPPQAEQVAVTYLGDEPATDPGQPLYYFQRAFQATRRRTVTVTAHSAAAPLSAAELAATRLVMVAAPLPEASVATLRDFATNGGTVCFLLRTNATAATLAALAGVPDVAVTDQAPTSYAMFGTIAFDHPLFASLADSRFNDFTKIHFWKYRRLDPAQLPGARVLAKYDNGDPAFLELARGRGRLLVVTSGWQPADSQLALSSKFVPLLYAILELAGGLHGQVTQGVTGEPIDLAGALPAGAGAAAGLVVTRPDGGTVTLAAGQTQFAGTEQPGLYSVAAPGAPLVRFAVNLAAGESRTAPLPVEELARLGVPLQAAAPAPQEQAARQRRLHDNELESQQKLWRWLTLAALVVLLLETLLAGRATLTAPVQLEGKV